MKWVYITFAVLGGLVPTAYLYACTYASAENKVGAFDLRLVFLGLGLSFMAMPLGIAGGLLVVGPVHLSLNLLQRRRRPSVPLAAQGEHQQGARQSWVTRDLGKQDPRHPAQGKRTFQGMAPTRRCGKGAVPFRCHCEGQSPEAISQEGEKIASLRSQ